MHNRPVAALLPRALPRAAAASLHRFLNARSVSLSSVAAARQQGLRSSAVVQAWRGMVARGPTAGRSLPGPLLSTIHSKMLSTASRYSTLKRAEDEANAAPHDGRLQAKYARELNANGFHDEVRRVQ